MIYSLFLYSCMSYNGTFTRYQQSTKPALFNPILLTKIKDVIGKPSIFLSFLPKMQQFLKIKHPSNLNAIEATSYRDIYWQWQ